jgi:hypothetical protein
LTQEERELCEFVVREDDFFEGFDVDERLGEGGEAVLLDI